MDIKTAWQWIAYATRRSLTEVYQVLRLTDEQALLLGEMLSHSKLIYPNLAKPKPKTRECICHCGCGQRFTATYVTRWPLYLNAAHKARLYRRRSNERKAGVYHGA